jgi:hypothetical protein
MLNLSDRELDRVTKEAAQEYEPGEVLGPKSWERLEVRLDNSPGGLNPNPLRHFRRFPFYYAPALLVLIGVSYYFVKQGTKGSGSPPTFGMAKAPATAPVDKNASSTTNSVYSDKSTPVSSASSVDPSTTSPSGGVGASAPVAAGGANAGGSSSDAGSLAAGNSAAGASVAGSSVPGSSAKGSGVAGAFGNRGAGSGLTGSGYHGRGARRSGSGAMGGNGMSGERGGLGQDGASGRNGGLGQNGVLGQDAVNGQRSAAEANGAVAGSRARELNRSTIGGLASTKNRGFIPDSNLRKFTLKSLPQGMRPRAMYVNRNLQIGLIFAPDFTSVNSLAGDKAGSTVGLTLDYQFANHWYIGSGLLLDRKNYAARAQDYHAPNDFYQNNIFAQHLNYVKGSFEMLEIPLNLRYDFSVSGSTMFFASAGVSSYLMTTEHSGMYGDSWGQPYRAWNVPGQHSTLFAAANLSLGVETGISNSLSLLIAPYMKIPTRGVGYGQVQMSSVGINFALKFSPVISRKRK